MKGAAFGLLVACPDCGSTARLHADPSCPTARAVDASTEDDAAWFRARPGVTERRRPVSAAEVAEAASAGVHIEITDTCVVTQIVPGFRSRRFEYVRGGAK